ncbi:SseB family protein [Horticoccus luteus]|uniref:SseB family protein n=1 Tax=Horticoccus luteus TaxID=2862869 RepID=A0A8F9TT67_9BACT|nr:SseB family protein [Horticoccus luteus]QYM78600.1 SseB family protein [Horticoccus luteus]
MALGQNMNRGLVDLLKQLPDDVTVVVELYRALFSGRFWVLAQHTDHFHATQFLTYPAADGARELPVFTSADRELLVDLHRQVSAAEVREVDGRTLWPRLIDVLDSDTFVAVDAAEKHGIRLSKAMIMGFVKLHGER